MFGVLTMHLLRLVNHGFSFEGAEDIMGLLRRFPLRHSFYVWYKPHRNLLSWPKPDPKAHLSSYHLIEYNRELQTASAKYHSDIGTAIRFEIDDAEGLKRVLTSAARQQKGKHKRKDEAGKFANDYNFFYIHQYFAWFFTKYRVAEASSTKGLSSNTHPSAWEYIVDTTFNPSDVEAILPSSQIEGESYQKRKVEFQRNKMEKANEVAMETWDEYLKEREENDVSVCGMEEVAKGGFVSGRVCLCTFNTKGGRQRHIAKGKHIFPALDLVTLTHHMHLSNKFAFSLALGSLPNRNSYIIKSRGVDIEVGKTNPVWNANFKHDWFGPGCYKKHTKKSFRCSTALRLDLEALFMEGLVRDGAKKGSTKFTPLEARMILKNMELSNGRRKYSPDISNLNGPLPEEKYIQSWFHRRKKKLETAMKEKQIQKKKGRNDGIDASAVSITNSMFEIDDGGSESESVDSSRDEGEDGDNNKEALRREYQKMSITALKKLIERRLDISEFKPKIFFIKLLEIHNALSGILDQNDYSTGYKLTDIKVLCSNLGLPSDTNKPSVIKLLEYNDEVKKQQLHKAVELPQMTHIINRSEILNSLQESTNATTP